MLGRVQHPGADHHHASLSISPPASQRARRRRRASWWSSSPRCPAPSSCWRAGWEAGSEGGAYVRGRAPEDAARLHARRRLGRPATMSSRSSASSVRGQESHAAVPGRPGSGPTQGGSWSTGWVFDGTPGSAGVHLPPQARHPALRLPIAAMPSSRIPTWVAENVAFGRRDGPGAAKRRRRTADVLGQAGDGGPSCWPLSGPLSGRAAARRPGPRDRAGSGGAAPRRAALGARRAAPRGSSRDELRAPGRRASPDRSSSSPTTSPRPTSSATGWSSTRAAGSSRPGRRPSVLGRPASEPVARLIGLRNVVRGTVVKTAPDRIEIAWRGHTRRGGQLAHRARSRPRRARRSRSSSGPSTCGSSGRTGSDPIRSTT